MVSNKQVFLEILEQLLFRTFQNNCFNYLARSIFECFCKTTRPYCSISFWSLRLCAKCTPCFISSNKQSWPWSFLLTRTSKLKYRPFTSLKSIHKSWPFHYQIYPSHPAYLRNLGLHKTSGGTTKKCENKNSTFFLRPGLRREWLI